MLDSEVLASKLLLRAFGRAVLIQNGSENRQEQNAGVDERRDRIFRLSSMRISLILSAKFCVIQGSDRNETADLLNAIGVYKKKYG